jgi:hypothetical protein
MPVLAKETVESAGMEKDRLILVSVFGLFRIGIFGIAAIRTSWANPIPHTVCRERVMIPREIPFVGSTPGKLCPDI